MATRWKIKDDALFQRFNFEDFNQALAFVNKVGEQAELLQHHPDIALGWGYVEVSIRTHSRDAVTDKDYKLAQAINMID